MRHHEPMSEVRLLVVEHERGTGPERFGEGLIAAGADLEICRPHLGEAVPTDLGGYAGLVVLGGSSGPGEDADNPWFPQVRSLLRRSAAGELPSFNICLGGEMLAAATSARILRRRHPQIGVHELRITSAGETDPVFAALSDGGDGTFPAVLFHQEEMELPAGAQLLVTGSDAPVQAFRVGESAWGTQFHPETDAVQIARWLAADSLPLPAGKTNESIIAEVRAADEELARVSRLLAGAFVDHLRGIVEPSTVTDITLGNC